ncbi:MAG: hypothetical protein U0228_09990 [Myxococcaceae bacterium]
MSRPLASVLTVGFLALGCATTPAPAPTTEPTASLPDAGSDDLATAWDKQPEKAPVPPQRPPEEPKVDRFAGYKAALADGQSAFKSKQYDAARSAAQKATAEAATLDGEARFQAWQLATKVELAANDAAAAESAARAWLLACGPEKLDSCRQAAVNALSAAAKEKGADKGLGREVTELRDDETCAAKTEKAPKPQPCEPTALARARKNKDEVLELRVLLGQALREDDESKQVRLLEKAEASCVTAQCSGLRRKALQKLIARAREKNDVDGAVKWALKEVAVVADTLPENERTWARTGTLDQTCVSYDTAHGAGACRALERKTLSRWTFHDYSKDAAGEGLSADQVRMVNDHFAPLLQECLAEQAKRMMPPDAQRFEVRWVVFNDGRVGEAHLRRDLDETPLAKCLRSQFVTWRYPRYDGEYQNVEQAFTVTASERRIR